MRNDMGQLDVPPYLEFQFI